MSSHEAVKDTRHGSLSNQASGLCRPLWHCRSADHVDEIEGWCSKLHFSPPKYCLDNSKLGCQRCREAIQLKEKSDSQQSTRRRRGAFTRLCARAQATKEGKGARARANTHLGTLLYVCVRHTPSIFPCKVCENPSRFHSYVQTASLCHQLRCARLQTS